MGSACGSCIAKELEWADSSGSFYGNHAYAARRLRSRDQLKMITKVKFHLATTTDGNNKLYMCKELSCSLHNFQVLFFSSFIVRDLMATVCASTVQDTKHTL